MKEMAEFKFIPKRWNLNRYDGLKYYSKIIKEQCKWGIGEERESSHYIEYTYFKWEFDAYVVKLYWCDEEEWEDWLCLEIQNVNLGDALSFAEKVKDKMGAFISKNIVE